MPKMSKPRIAQRKPRRNTQRRGRAQNQGPRNGLPKPTSATDTKPRYNPTWNPQYLKVARKFQYSAPAADLAAGYGKVADLTVGATATLLAYAAAAYSFNVSDVPGVAEFTTLFDQYKIVEVKLDFQYISASEATLNTAVNTNNQICTLMVYEDNDDTTAPAATNAGWSAVLESGRAKSMIFPNKKNQFSYVLRPKVLQADLDTAGTTLARSEANPWLDPATTDAKYFGLKIIAQSNPGIVTYLHQFRIVATYYMQWRARQ